MSGAYYNEIDPGAAQWLRNLIKRGVIAPGEVDERSIEDVLPSDLRGFTQCHFFAGIGVWSHALRRAGWEDDRQVWTGSCPCQPFSAAGKGNGFADERHLWPAFYHLISQCRPGVVFGEQVASKDGLDWLDLVRSDLEAESYACAAFDLCAAGFGAPHIRQRLYWVADSANSQCTQFPNGKRKGQKQGLTDGRAADRLGNTVRTGSQGTVYVPSPQQSEESQSGSEQSVCGGLADADERAGTERGSDVRGRSDRSDAKSWAGPGSGSVLGGLAGASSQGPQGGKPAGERTDAQRQAVERVGEDGGNERSLPTNGFWRSADWLAGRDGKWRPVEPNTFPLAHGAASRVVRLRAYGNAIVAPVAVGFIEAYAEARGIVFDQSL